MLDMKHCMICKEIDGECQTVHIQEQEKADKRPEESTAMHTREKLVEQQYFKYHQILPITINSTLFSIYVTEGFWRL